MVRETFGAALRRHRKRHGYSLRAFAKIVQYQYTYLWELEAGRKRGTAEVATRCDEALEAGGELVGLMAEGATVPSDSALQLVPRWAEAVEAVTDLWRGDMERRRLLVDAAFTGSAFGASAMAWFVGGGASPLTGSGRTAVRMADVESVRAMTTTFRALDNRFGGGQARAAVVRFLDGEVAPLLRDGRYDMSTGRALLSATAELTHLAGWMAHDVGQHGLAQRYVIQALQLAMAATDQPLGAELLAGMSHQAVYLGAGKEGAELARASARTAKRADVAVLVAEAAVMEGHAEATNGDAAACGRALNRAERALDRADRSADPQWIRYFDEAYLSAKFGHAFSALGDHNQAERFARRSLIMNGEYVRGRAFNLALLATALIGRGEVDEAASVASDAQALAENLRSTRATRYVDELRTRLTAYHDSAPVRAFLKGSG